MPRCVTVRVALLLLAAATLTAHAAEPPVAPAPDAGREDSEVRAVTHREAATHRDAEPLGPVVLGPASPAAPRTSAAPRPVPEWRLLAALGGAFAAVAAYRVLGGRRSAPLPADVFELLGEASLGGQHAVRVVRFGPRTLLVAVSSSGARTLAELTDPQATERIVAACHGGAARSPGRRRISAGRDTGEGRS